MRVVILCQEEPVFLGPFLQGVLRQRPAAVVAVFVAGTRSAGERQRTWRERVTALHTFWLIMEPAGWLHAAALRLRARLLGTRDPRSVAGLARRLGIPVVPVGDPNTPAFHAQLRALAPDVVLNQSELLLRAEVLAIPRLGFLNRHASLLPQARGRMGAFWAHAQEPPSYGLTLHCVDAGIDTGAVVLQQPLAVDAATWSYPRVMAALLADAPTLFWTAVDRLATPGFMPTPQPPSSASPHRFPTLAEARAYRQVLARRRRKGPEKPSAD